MRIRRVIALIALIGWGVVGLNNATSWPVAQTDAQKFAAAVAVGAGVLGLICAAALWRRIASLNWLLVTWSVSMAAAAGLAPWAWGGAPARVCLTAALVGAAIAAVVTALAWPSRAA